MAKSWGNCPAGLQFGRPTSAGAEGGAGLSEPAFDRIAMPLVFRTLHAQLPVDGPRGATVATRSTLSIAACYIRNHGVGLLS